MFTSLSLIKLIGEKDIEKRNTKAHLFMKLAKEVILVNNGEDFFDFLYHFNITNKELDILIDNAELHELYCSSIFTYILKDAHIEGYMEHFDILFNKLIKNQYKLYKWLSSNPDLFAVNMEQKKIIQSLNKYLKRIHEEYEGFFLTMKDWKESYIGMYYFYQFMTDKDKLELIDHLDKIKFIAE